MEILNTRIAESQEMRRKGEHAPAHIPSLTIEEMIAAARRPLSSEEAEAERQRIAENRRTVEEHERAEALATWKAKCPLRIQSNDWNHDSLRPFQRHIRRILGWQRQGQGIYAVGKPGRGKSRALWWLAHRLAVDELVPLRYLAQSEILNEVNRTGLDPWLEKMWSLRNVPVLVWDDFGNFAAMQSRQDVLATELFGLIDHRFNAMLPMLISSNVRADGLTAIFGDRTEAIMRRLMEGNEMVDFDDEVRS
ncbi:ATP-binding protein [Opitutaceae bacterium TAV4]|nr:ATP-binding protein [Opitutaceae bacterium TAV4]RRK00780.1 ATP-binding protein [Opitutaceae bacterium TAV3]